MIRVELNDEQREELRRLSHQGDIAPRTRDRLEMVRLADAGWSIPRIARHLGYHEQTVRQHIKRYLAGGFDRLPDRPGERYSPPGQSGKAKNCSRRRSGLRYSNTDVPLRA